MTVYVNTAVRFVANTTALSSWVDELTVNATCDIRRRTPIGGTGGWRRARYGLKQFNITAKGMADLATDGTDAAFPATALGTAQDVLTVMPIGDGATLADPAFLGLGRSMSIMPFGGPVGEESSMSIDWAGDGRLARGVILHPSAARTSTGSGTAVALAGPTADQSIFANFHVTSVSGSGTITFTIETDDASNFASSTTRITSSAFAAVGAEQKSATPGDISTETHFRVGWTISGFTSVTFEVAVAVAS